MSHKVRFILCALLLSWMCIGCSNVTVLRLTSETFPPRSVEEVTILSQEPIMEHIRIAELRVPPPVSTCSRGTYSKKQRSWGRTPLYFRLPKHDGSRESIISRYTVPGDSMPPIILRITMAQVRMDIRGLSAMPTEDGGLPGASAVCCRTLFSARHDAQG
jgi:hypothetical protein